MAVDSVPILTLGQWDTREEAQAWQQPIRATVVGDSLVAILEAESGEVRVFDWAGELQERRGGRGGGPGEFRDTPWFLADAGTQGLIAVDGSVTRANIYRPDGTDVGVSLPAGGDPLPDVFGLLDGAPPQLVVGYESIPPSGLGRAQLAVVALGLRSPVLVDTLGVFPGTEYIEETLDEGVAVRAAPESPSLLVAVRGDRVVLAATDDSIRVLDRRGRSLQTLAMPTGQARWEGRDLRAIHLDGSGRLWLARKAVPGERVRRWIVFDLPTGEFTRELRVPGDIRGFGPDHLVLARAGEMSETLFEVYRVADVVRSLGARTP